jgi:hypothetical protein
MTGASRAALLGLVAATSAIPGFALLADEAWSPPNARVFPVLASAIGVMIFGVVLLGRRRIERARRRTRAVLCVAAVAVGFVGLETYQYNLNTVARTYRYENLPPRRVVIPYGVGSWMTPDLLDRLHRALPPPRDTISAASVGRDDVVTALVYWGPLGLEKDLPAGWTELTNLALLLHYSLAVGLFVFAFSVLAVSIVREEADAPAPGAAAGPRTVP